MNLGQRLEKIQLVVTDCDGTLTDGGIYYSSSGETLVRFDRRDGMGFDLLRQAGLIVGIMTRENSEIVRQRGEKLQVDELHVGILDKRAALKEILDRRRLSRDQVAFIGDDLNDLAAFRVAGFRACPADSADEVKAQADLVLSRSGGHGAFRELANRILAAKDFRSSYIAAFANPEEE